MSLFSTTGSLVWVFGFFLGSHSPGFAGGGFVALAGTRCVAAECAPGSARPAGLRTFSVAAHTPVLNTNVFSMKKMDKHP